MSSSPISGFVKKKVAAKKYKRSARQLTRDITVAMELKDEKVLQHLKLRTADGEVFDGGEVTTELVTKLHKAEGRNPMWYLRRTWLEEAFGRRDESSEDVEPPASDDLPEPSAAVKEPASDGDNEVRELLREAVTELRSERDFLKSQIEAKDKQLDSALERDRESNVLLKNLQELMGNLQEELLALPNPNDGNVRPTRSTPVESPVVSATATKSADVAPKQEEEAVAPIAKQESRKPKTAARSKRTKKKTSAGGAKKNKAVTKRSRSRKKAPPPSFTEKYLPTLSRFFTNNK